MATSLDGEESLFIVTVSEKEHIQGIFAHAGLTMPGNAHCKEEREGVAGP